MRQIIRLLLAESQKNDVEKPLTFTAEQANSTVKLIKSGSPTVSGLQYRLRKSGGWTPYVIDTVITLANVGDVVQFQNTEQTLSTSNSNRVLFVMKGKIGASGNVQSMLNYIEQCKSYCYYQMFSGCSSLTTAPELPATTLATFCYSRMFDDCTSLTTAPELPATTLASSCYAYMFDGCSSLTTAPVLPATTLADNCYAQMFQTCTSLTTAPELPATTLANYCYREMFCNCRSLTTAPVLPAINLDWIFSCYDGMFKNCSSLTTAPELPATTLASQCYYQMFSGCSSLTTAPVLPATTLEDNCYRGMFQNCSNLTTAPELPATSLEMQCYNGMFQNCTSLTTAPDLPATTLARSCYYAMFSGCTKLNYIKVGFTNWLDSATTDWVKGVSASGTFEAPIELPVILGTSNIPENWNLPNHTYIILTEDQKISQNYQQTVDYTIQYVLLPETLQPTFTIVQGELPNGLTLDSSTGVISGNLTEEFVGDIQIQISCEGCESVTITLSFTLHNYQETENNLTADDSNPNYTVSQNTTYSNSSSYSAWKAMDGNTTTYSKTAYSSGQYGWWQIDFHQPVFLGGFTLTCDNGSSYGTYLEASEDGTTWTRIDSTKIPDNTTTTREYKFTTPYQYYRFINETSYYYVQFYEIKFLYQYAENIIIVDNQSINQNYQQTVDYAIQYSLFPETLQPTFTIVQGELPNGLTLDSSTGVISGTSTTEFVGDVKIQISCEGCESVVITLSLTLHNYQETENNLTADDSNPNYTVSQRTTNGSYSAWKAMDGNTSTYSKTQYASGQYDWWQIDFHKPVFLIGFTLNCNNEGSYGTYLQASTDATTWIRIDSTKITDNTTTTREYEFTTPYRYYRLISERTNYYIQFYQVKFKYKE